MPSRAIPVPTSGATKRAVHRAQRSAARILATELDGLLVNGYDGPVPTAFPPGGGAGVDYFRQAKRLYAFVNAARAALVSIRGTTNVPLLDASAAVRPQHALSVTAVNRIIEEVSAALDDDPGEPPPANPKTAVLVGIGGASNAKTRAASATGGALAAGVDAAWWSRNDGEWKTEFYLAGEGGRQANEYSAAVGVANALHAAFPGIKVRFVLGAYGGTRETPDNANPPDRHWDTGGELMRWLAEGMREAMGSDDLRAEAEAGALAVEWLHNGGNLALLVETGVRTQAEAQVAMERLVDTMEAEFGERLQLGLVLTGYDRDRAQAVGQAYRDAEDAAVATNPDVYLASEHYRTIGEAWFADPVPANDYGISPQDGVHVDNPWMTACWYEAGQAVAARIEAGPVDPPREQEPPPEPYVVIGAGDAAVESEEGIEVAPLRTGIVTMGQPSSFEDREVRRGIGLVGWDPSTRTFFRSRVADVRDADEEVEVLASGVASMREGRPALELLAGQAVAIGQLPRGRVKRLVVRYLDTTGVDPVEVARWEWDGAERTRTRMGVFRRTDLPKGEDDRHPVGGTIAPMMGTVFLEVAGLAVPSRHEFRAMGARRVWTGPDVAPAVQAALDAGSNVYVQHAGDKAFVCSQVRVPAGRAVVGQGSPHPENETGRATLLVSPELHDHHLLPKDAPFGTGWLQEAQAGFTLRGLHGLGDLGAVDLLMMGDPDYPGASPIDSASAGKPPDWHGAFVHAVEGARLEDCVFEGYQGDGEYWSGQSVKRKLTGAELFTRSAGGAVVTCGAGLSRTGTAVREGQTKPTNPLPPNVEDLLFWMRDAAGVEIGASTGTRPLGGWCPLFEFPAWSGDPSPENPEVVGYLDPVQGVCRFGVGPDGEPLPNGNAGYAVGAIVAGGYEEYGMLAPTGVSRRTGARECCRNGYGNSSTEVAGTTVTYRQQGVLEVVGNGLGGLQRIGGKIARDAQYHSARSALEHHGASALAVWEVATEDAGVKIGQEPGPVYPFGSASWERITVRAGRKAYDCEDTVIDVYHGALEVLYNGADTPVKVNPTGRWRTDALRTEGCQPNGDDFLLRIGPDTVAPYVGPWTHVPVPGGPFRAEVRCDDATFERPPAGVRIEFEAGTTGGVVIDPDPGTEITGPHTVVTT